MAQDTPRPRMLRGDEADLFRQHEVALRAAVHHHARAATDDIIQDACSFAWLELCRRQPERDNVFAWLRTVATRRAWKLISQQARESPLGIEDVYHPLTDDLTTTAARNAEIRQLLQDINSLSPHQRRVLVLFLRGHSYNEIASHHDLSRGAVNKALVRARRHLRLVHDAD